MHNNQYQYQQASFANNKVNNNNQPNNKPSKQQLLYWFEAIDTDKNGHLTINELQRALMNGDWTPFNIETVRLMVNMFDKDQSGSIQFSEFASLWDYIEQWKQCFKNFDQDNSGTIDKSELLQALVLFGYNLSPRFVDVLIRKFDLKGKGELTFDNFIQACVTVKSLTDSFRRFDTDNDGWIYIQYEQFLELVISQK